MIAGVIGFALFAGVMTGWLYEHHPASIARGRVDTTDLGLELLGLLGATALAIDAAGSHDDYRRFVPSFLMLLHFVVIHHMGVVSPLSAVAGACMLVLLVAAVMRRRRMATVWVAACAATLVVMVVEAWWARH